MKKREDSFCCPRCDQLVARSEIALYPAHKQLPHCNTEFDCNTGFEWVGVCPHCENKRIDEREDIRLCKNQAAEDWEASFKSMELIAEQDLKLRESSEKGLEK